ncbi:MAG TPA: hypothetical protein VF765_37275 [Polyangiaceae bacterium]
MTRAAIYAFVVVAVSAAAAVAAGSLAACSDPLAPTTHPVMGNAYDAVDNCLQPQQSFDFVDGPAPSVSCDVVCITDAKTGTTYVTNQCGPFPIADSVEGSDAGGDTCALALAAWAAGNECGSATDAGGDATEDATEDAPAEAASEAATEAGPEAGGDARADAPLDAKGDGP